MIKDVNLLCWVWRKPLSLFLSLLELFLANIEGVGAMEDQCMVMCGEWVCDNGGKWNFVLDKRQMARLVPLYEGMSLFELQRNVLREFCVEEGLFVAALSYWPPSNLELATGIKTPPVLLTSDGGIRYFLQHLRVKGAMNLFVKFERTSFDDFVDDSGMGFWSSCSTQKEAPFVTAEDCNPKVSGGSSSHCFVTREGPTDAPEEARIKIPTSRVVNGEDVEFVREVERVEEVINCGSVFRHEEVLSGKNVLEDAVDEVDERDVRPRGYDKDFWSPLLNDDYGGSNVVNVIYNEDELVEDLMKNNGGRSSAKSDSDVKMVLMPPVTKRQPGRRRKNRIPSIGEYPVTKKTKLVPNKCGRCRIEGHNRSSCTNPI
ncbi:hypothetical protein F2Q69_00004979 [Brassica cretica]|uniref:Uncharacterized protein n=1 Tax=Brassica cretica TaxID=69181 RepID=A0A8S9PN47_BRACR|nr:hypothetical protein F2Q69_00004979 [Brassica cretica]